MISKRPVIPVKPSSMELVFVYSCPFCARELPMVAPSVASMVRCDVCTKQFPVVPVEQRTVDFVKLMLANGKAAVDSDFL